MAYALAYLLLFLLPYLLPYSVVAQTNGTITVGASITAGDKATPWLSPSEDFAFGFKQLQGKKQLFWLSIWYQRIPDQTIIWYANQSVPAPTKSKVELTDRGLVLKNPEGSELWRSEPIIGEVDHGFMNDTGNFELVGGYSVNVWESFKYPTDTLLPTQKLEPLVALYSPRSKTNFSRGRFQLRLLPDGNLVLNTRDMVADLPNSAYYISGTYDPNNSMNSGKQVVFNETGHMYILIGNGARFDLTPEEMKFPTTGYYHRATLNFDGVFAQYAYPKNPTDDSNWTTVWYKPDDICSAVVGVEGGGACGYNSICTLTADNRPACECPPGYSLLDPDDKYGSCTPNFTRSCEDDDSNSPEDLYDFEVLTDTAWPTPEEEKLKPSNEELCRNSCLHDCFCSVAIFKDDSCWKKKPPLSNGRKDSTVNERAFIKFRKGSLPPESAPKTPRGPERGKDRGTLVLVGSVLLGSSLFFNFLLIGAFCVGFFLIYRKKSIRTQNGDNSKDPNLRFFTYKELDEATDGFKEELGRGGCGVVYKGVMQMGATNVVAVKKLDRVVQEREKEFKTEVNVIGRTHHKNLVRLLGFCDEGQHRMLVYEYLSNGTLSTFLFGESKPSWNRRTEIALGIARGLLYLHEECSTQIIHCDIKPQNILLDDYYNARISDFGLAKLMMIDQSKTIATIRGTKGYVAPEWFNNKPITAKVDIYSFGVLLLEIITCRRNVADMENGREEQAILTYWASDCYQDGKLDALVENDMEALNDWKKLERFFMVAFWCIHDDPSLRPTMRKVNQMLEGVVEVARPPCPSQFSFIH